MKLRSLSVYNYEISMKSGQMRSGIFIHLTDDNGKEALGEIAPLPKWSQETLDQSIAQLKHFRDIILNQEWLLETIWDNMARLHLLPSVAFGLESALLTMLDPQHEFQVSASALLMGSPKEILSQATVRINEGFKSAKLKVSHLTFSEASHIIHELKDRISLRIDVNRAWETKDSLHFFSQFSIDTFDYVEEPFKNPLDLEYFSHPLAVDESYRLDLSLSDLEKVPALKALIYKPTIQGGYLCLKPLKKWAKSRDVEVVLSSSFESDIGLAHLASVANRFSLDAPIGVGTFHHMDRLLCPCPLVFFQGKLQVKSHSSIPSFDMFQQIL